MTTEKCGRCGKNWNLVEDYIKHKNWRNVGKVGQRELLKEPRANIFQQIKILIHDETKNIEELQKTKNYIEQQKFLWEKKSKKEQKEILQRQE